jgi:hypothetical protein
VLRRRTSGRAGARDRGMRRRRTNGERRYDRRRRRWRRRLSGGAEILRRSLGRRPRPHDVERANAFAERSRILARSHRARRARVRSRRPEVHHRDDAHREQASCEHTDEECRWPFGVWRQPVRHGPRRATRRLIPSVVRRCEHAHPSSKSRSIRRGPLKSAVVRGLRNPPRDVAQGWSLSWAGRRSRRSLWTNHGPAGVGRHAASTSSTPARRPCMARCAGDRR